MPIDQPKPPKEIRVVSRTPRMDPSIPKATDAQQIEMLRAIIAKPTTDDRLRKICEEKIKDYEERIAQGEP